MSPEKRAFLLNNVVGGLAVLGSYALWLANPSNDGGALWGSIAGAGRTACTVSMLAATAGYFAFAPWILRLDAARVRLTAVNTCFTLILFPSALWMPLAFEYLDAPGPTLWWAMHATLGVVGLASLALVVLLARLSPALRGIRALAAGLGPCDGVLIHPEGTRVTPRKQAHVREALARSDPDRASRLAGLRHVLPPRTGGPLALLGAEPPADAVFMAHAGLDGQWLRMDDWVETHLRHDRHRRKAD